MDYGGDDYGGGGGFYGAGAQGGGGFDGANTSPGQQKSSRGGNAPKARTLIPVSIKQVLNDLHPETSGDGYRLDDREVNQLRIVGLMQDIQDTDTGAVVLKIHDTTGVLECTYYPELEDVGWANTRSSLIPNTYVEVVVNVKPAGSSASVQVLHIRKVVDSNQITHHLFSVLYASLERQQGPLQGVVMPAASSSSSHGAPMYGVMGGGYGQPIISSSSGMGGDGQYGDQRTRAVLAAFEADRDSEEGTSVYKIAASVKHLGLELPEISSIVEQLTTDGVVYSTIDEYHFKLTG